MRKRIEKHALRVLRDLSLLQVPIDVEEVAKGLNLTVTTTDLGPGVSGALFMNQNGASIGVNPADPKVRRRFTIAHEIGHFQLHPMTTGLFIDRDYYVSSKILFRNAESKTGERTKEREANAFAAALLMPIPLLQAEINQIIEEKPTISDEELTSHLAKTFEVSEMAMAIRLSNLHFLHTEQFSD